MNSFTSYIQANNGQSVEASLLTLIERKRLEMQAAAMVEMAKDADWAVGEIQERILNHEADTRAANPRAITWQTGTLAGSTREEKDPNGLGLTIGPRGYRTLGGWNIGILYEYGTGAAGAESPSPPKGPLPPSAYSLNFHGQRARPSIFPVAVELREIRLPALLARLAAYWSKW